MRKDLSPNFLAHLASYDRSPVLLAEFRFPTEIVYVSDQPIGIDDGFTQDYLPIVESWGSLRDNVRIEPIIGASSLEARQLQITLINMGKRFSYKFRNTNPENVRVNIYQWFVGLDPSEAALIDTFVCQDPIVISEAQALVSIELVSPIMANNNFIWGPNRYTEVRYPLLIGKLQVAARSMETGPLATLLYDIDQTFTGITYIEVTSRVVDFPESGFIFINSEQLAYDSYRITQMNITGRGRNGTSARPHIRGATVTNPTANYDFSLTAGPVQKIENIVGDGEPYVNQYTVFDGTDPTFIRFPGRPPWHRVETGNPGTPITPPEENTTQFGVSAETYAEVVSAPSGATNINNSSSNVSMAIDNTVGSNATLTSQFGTGYQNVDPTGKITFSNNGGMNTEAGGSSAGASAINDGDGSAALQIGNTGHFESSFGRDLSAYGTFVSCGFHVAVDRSFTNQSVRLDIICNDNIVHTRAATSGTASWSQTVELSTAIIGSWSQLQSAKVWLQWTVTSFGGTTHYFRVRWDRCRWHVNYIANATPTNPLQEVVSHFNRDLSSLGALRNVQVQVRFDCSSINSNVTQSIIARSDSNQGNNQTLWSRTITSTQGMATQTVSPSVGSMAALRNLRVGVRHRVNSPTTPGSRRTVITNVAWVQWIITYQPGDIDQPDELRVVYVTQLYADVTSSLGALVTPPKAIEHVISTTGGIGYKIDTANFEEYHQLYEAAGFYFNGIVDGAMRFHDALRSLVRQAAARLAYNTGQIKFVSSFIHAVNPAITSEFNQHFLEMKEKPEDGELWADYADTDNIVYFFKEDIRMRSVTEQRMRFDDIFNRIIFRYLPDPLDTVWEGEYVAEDVASIDEIGLQETSMDYRLVRDQDIIQLIAQHVLDMQGTPKTFTTFRVYMKAFPLEKNDFCFFETDFNDYYGVTGRILTINRIFGSGKSHSMNIFEVTIMSAPITVHRIEAKEAVQIGEAFVIDQGFGKELRLYDQVNINENFILEPQFARELKLFDRVEIQDIYENLYGVAVLLNLSDRVSINDLLNADVTEPIFINLLETVAMRSQFGSFHYTEHRLDILETVEIEEVVLTETSIGYGLDGYGLPPYGG